MITLALYAVVVVASYIALDSLHLLWIWYGFFALSYLALLFINLRTPKPSIPWFLRQLIFFYGLHTKPRFL